MEHLKVRSPLHPLKYNDDDNDDDGIIRQCDSISKHSWVLICRKEMKELVESGVLTKEELEEAIAIEFNPIRVGCVLWVGCCQVLTLLVVINKHSVS